MYKGGRGAAPPEQECATFVHGLIQEMGGIPQYLQSPQTPRRSGAEGEGGEAPVIPGVREGAPPPLGGRGMPEEQARAIVASIVKFPLEGGPPSGQVPEIQRQQAQKT